MEEMSAQALAAWDTENRFRSLAAQGDVQQALAILDRLDGIAKSTVTTQVSRKNSGKM